MDKKRLYSCDLETTTDPEDCRVWATIWLEIGNTDNYQIGTDFNDYMNWMINSNSICYFHNVKFDGSFIVNWLLHKGWKWVKKPKERGEFSTLISKMGQWYSIIIHNGKVGKKISQTKVYCSNKKLPFTVDRIAKAFKLPMLKGEIDYHKERPVGYELTEEEKNYIINDAAIVALALQTQFEQNLMKMTTGSDALNEYTNVVSENLFKRLFPILSLETNFLIRQAYRGGFTWLNPKHAETVINDGIVFDVNSLYPSVMYSKPMPCGVPIEGVGEYVFDKTHPLYIQEVTFEFKLKKDHIPTIQLKNSRFGFKGNEYLSNSNGERITMYVSSVDWELIKEHYEIFDEEYIRFWKFRKTENAFKKYIDKWLFVKITSTGALKELAKLMLNSLYGKFATNPDITGKIPYLKDDGSTGFTLPKKSVTKDDGTTEEVIDEEFRDPIYTPVGVFITSYAREVTIRSAQKCYDRIIYCDTDSLHLTGLEIPNELKELVDPDKLGYWKNEGQFRRGKFLRQKTYIEEYYAKYNYDKLDDDGNPTKEQCDKEEHETVITKVVCAGMSDRVKKKVTFDNFNVGFTASDNLKPKQVYGGVVLIDNPFKIM